MRGVVLPGNRTVDLREFPTPQPGYGQVLVRMKASGICGSDIRAIYREWLGTGPEAYRGCIAGHEPCGIVEEVGPGVEHFRPGDRVVVYLIVGCGVCKDCRAGWMINCKAPYPYRAAYGWQRDGGHADFLLAEQRTLIKLPDNLTFIDGALAACGLGTGYQAILRAGVSGRDRVAVVGLGPVGLGILMLARASGAEVIGIDVIPERLEMAQKIGAEHTFLSGDNTAERIMDLTKGEGVEVVIDASGNPLGRHLCLEIAGEWGRVVFVGEGNTVSFEPSPLLIHKQLTLMGSWVCGLVQMEELLGFLSRKELHPEQIVTHKFPLEDADEAYRLFDSGKSGKVVITWD